jgi:dTDP-L-rhamnose 4-epimerase
MAIFSNRLLNDSAPLINEDGLQRRDFVSVKDVVDAFALALSRRGAGGQIFNVGSGQSVTIREVAGLVAGALGRAHIAPSVTGQHRAGDIRHCFADLQNAREGLGFTPRVPLAAGLAELAAWLATERPQDDDLTPLPRARRPVGARRLAL